jgi:hypothetical protein
LHRIEQHEKNKPGMHTAVRSPLDGPTLETTPYSTTRWGRGFYYPGEGWARPTGLELGGQDPPPEAQSYQYTSAVSMGACAPRHNSCIRFLQMIATEFAPSMDHDLSRLSAASPPKKRLSRFQRSRVCSPHPVGRNSISG